MMRRKYSGFTLIELMICMMVLAVLALLIVATYSESLKRGRDGQRKTDLTNIGTAFEAYYYDSGRYPRVEEFNVDGMLCNTSDDCAQIYMEKIPKDPSSKQSYYYETDENGTHYILYSTIENRNDNGNGVKQEGYPGDCNPSPCRYAKASTNVDTTSYIANSVPMVSGLLKKAAPTSSPTSMILPTVIVQTITPTPSPEVSMNQDYFDVTYDGLSSNIYYPMFKYQTLDVRCPKGYGVRDIRVKNKDNSRKDVKFMGCSFNVWATNNEYGAACEFAADSPFHGELIITCDKAYFNIMSFTPSQISNTPTSSLPRLFHLGEWFGQTSEKINDQQQGVSVDCPTGYKATNITCSTHFINYTLFNFQYQIEGLVSMDNDSVRTASCKYDAKNSFTISLSTICEKQ
ncbi:MAG: prepilin-type N-terminal cleavage/methylation domain-containing protein [Candidatus Roizmanbacteria bacterium]|nr:prepilin-type N-terminal cleavage/methylation domain-containing protein [Candidatus Roizmanbacteria bacterium]